MPRIFAGVCVWRRIMRYNVNEDFMNARETRSMTAYRDQIPGNSHETRCDVYGENQFYFRSLNRY